MKVIGYVRISDSEQSTDGLSLDTQEQAIRRACEQRGWECLAVLRDDGYTGRNDDRPGLDQARAMLAKRNRPDALVVSRLDRLTRSLKDLAVLIEESDKRWGIVALDFDLNTTTANGELVAHIIGAVARWESRMNSERTSAGMKAIHARKRAKGEAFGFQSQADPRTIKRIVRARSRGESFATIAKRLDRDTPPPGGGARWYPSTVERIYKRAS
jgi:DNA invertase Pin-like site-specific DNA recombinase